MLMRRFLAAAAALLLSVTAARAQQFDLLCDLTETNSLRPGETTAFSRHLSVDLTAGVWCLRDEDCKEIMKLKQVGPDDFHLNDVEDEVLSLVTVIDRHSWRWTNHAEVKKPFHAIGESRGACTVAPFTPFPAGQAG